MKAGNENNVLKGIKKEQLKQRIFTLEFKAEVLCHKKAESHSFTERGRKFDVLPKLIQESEKQYEPGSLSTRLAAAQSILNKLKSPARFDTFLLRD